MKIKKTFLSAIICLIIAGCSKDVGIGDYDSAEVGKIKKVIPGVVISMRPVRLHNKNAEAVTANDATDDSNTSRSHGFEYVIKLNSGNIISVVQAENIQLKNRQHILVIYGHNTRVVPDNGSEDF